MNKEIAYTGVSNTPSDYDVQDGQMTASVNMINEGRGMEAIFPLKETGLKLKDGQRLLYVHSNSTFRHFIIGDSYGLYWMEENKGAVQFSTALDAGHIASIISIGNTLVISATGYTGDKASTNGMNYFLWTENKYKPLGNSVPDIPVWFKLCATAGVQASEKTTVDVLIGNFAVDFPNYTYAAINPLIQEAKEDNKFVMPFFVRYAVRLFDGTLTKHSAPILMLPTTVLYPYAEIDTSAWPRQRSEKYTTGFTGKIKRTALYYYIRKEIQDKLADWSDIISSIDIFVSDQIYTFDTNWKTETLNPAAERSAARPGRESRAAGDTGTDVNVDAVPSFGIYQEDYNRRGDSVSNSPQYKYVQKHPQALTSRNPTASARGYSSSSIPARSKKLLKDIREESHFYLVKSMPAKELNTGSWKELVMDDGTLSSITAREAMTDDYNSHDRLYPRGMFLYNNRVNLYRLSREVYEGYEATTIIPYTNGHASQSANGGYVDDSLSCMYKIVVFIRENGTEYVAFGKLSYALDAHALPVYLYYPNVNAYRMVIWRSTADGKQTYYNIPLKKHAFLNGSYWFNDFKDPQPDTSIQGLPTLYDTIIPMPNQIYTSAVNNPFSFPVANILEVGTGKILSLASMTKPVSTGQFGEFPLYVFTTEGIWALQVGTDGSFVAKQPVSRDVCNNAGSITQIDNAVLFSTERGVMMIQGGSSAPLTDILDGPAFKTASLPHFDQLLKDAGLTSYNIPSVRFGDYIKGCGIAYDYIHQRLYVFNPGHSYAYVFSFKSKVWGMAVCSFAESLQAYPDTYITDKAGKILNLSQPDYSNPVNGMAVTRPLKFQAPDILKTVPTAIHRGSFNKGDVRGALYGSRDLIHWHLIGSSVNHYLRHCHGTPYKYFRFVINCTFARDESLSGTSVDFTPKQNGKLR